jgi:hypothetical protein
VDDPDIVALHAELLGIVNTDAVRRALVDQPSLLREAAAELGAEAPDLLADALERLGLDPSSGGTGAQMNVTTPSLDAEDQPYWQVTQTIKGSGLRDMTAALAQLVRENRSDPKLLVEIAQRYAAEVDRLIGQTVR